MSYFCKIRKELSMYSHQWHDAVCPNVAKYGKQADKEIKQLKEKINELNEELRKRENP